MNLKNQRPVFVPLEFQAEIEKLSKAALMDVVWDFAFQIGEEFPDKAMEEFRRRWGIVELHRKQQRA